MAQTQPLPKRMFQMFQDKQNNLDVIAFNSSMVNEASKKRKPSFIINQG